MLSFSLSTHIEGSFSLNCVNGKVAYSSSAVRSMTIFGEDGESVLSFCFFSTLTRLRLTHTTSCFSDKVALLEALSSLGGAEVALAIEGSAFTSPSLMICYMPQGYQQISGAYDPGYHPCCIHGSYAPDICGYPRAHAPDIRCKMGQKIVFSKVHPTPLKVIQQVVFNPLD